jgi:uncharacterized protein (UPF0264 family)
MASIKPGTIHIAFIGLAIVGMVFIGVAGLALAIAYFFLQC